MSYDFTLDVILYGGPSEVNVWTLDDDTIGLTADGCAEGGTVYLSPEEARKVAAALIRAAEEKESLR